MTRFRVATLLFASSLLAALAAGFLAATTIAIVTGGPGAILAALFAGVIGAAYGVVLATLPGLLLGSLLWWLRVFSSVIWAATGALVGLACLGLARIVFGSDEAVIMALDGLPTGLVPICMVAGAIGALLFRLLMRVLTASDDVVPDPRGPA